MNATLEVVREWLKVPKPKEILSIRSLYLFKRNNRFRKAVHLVVSSWIFEYIILTAIITSCVIVKNSRSQKGYDMSNPYALVDLLMNIIFGIEALLKITTYGFVMHRGSYLRNKWNVIDFMILVGGATSDLVLMFSKTEKSVSVKVLRLFRVMRPLRLIVRYDSLKVVLDTILTSFKTLMHVLFFMLLIIVMYAIVGIELFQGAFQTTCTDVTSGKISEPTTLCNIKDYNSCIDLKKSVCKQGVPDPKSSVSFDSIGYSLLTVIQVITMEDWMFIADKLNPVRNSFITYIYFISLVFIGGYFAVGLLMGILGNEFLKTKLFQNRQRRLNKARKSITWNTEEDLYGANVNYVKRDTGNALEYFDRPQPSRRSTGYKLTSLVSSLRKISFQMEDNMKRKCLPIIDSKFFYWLFISINITDIVFTSVYAHLSNNQIKLSYFFIMKIVVAFLYTVELIMVLLGRGIKSAPKHGTFLFDSFVLIITIAEFIAYAILKKHYVGLSSTRAISLIRIFKYTRVWPQLSLLIKSFCKAVKGTFGLMILLVIVLSIYALLGNQLFSKGDNINGNMGTFNTFASSFLMTFVLLTGDGWKGFMDDAMTDFNTPITIIYFISFVIFGNFILVNLFLGIIVDTLVSDYEDNIVIKEQLQVNVNNLTSRNIERLKKLHKTTGDVRKPSNRRNSKLIDKKEKLNEINDIQTNGISSPDNIKEKMSPQVLNRTLHLPDNNCEENNVNHMGPQCNSIDETIKMLSTNGQMNIRSTPSQDEPHKALTVESIEMCTSVLSQNSNQMTKEEINFGNLSKINDTYEELSESKLVERYKETDNDSPSHNGKEHSLTEGGSQMNDGIDNEISINQEVCFVINSGENTKNGPPIASAIELNIPPHASTNKLPIHSKKRHSKVRDNFRSLSIILDYNIEHPIPQHLSFFLFSHRNKFRVRVFSFITSSPCTIIIWFAIVSSSLLLAFQDPLKRDAKTENIMQIIDYTFTVIFLIEIILKSIAYGLVFGHTNCYLRDPMNVMDTIVVFVAFLNFYLKQFDVDDFVHLRMLRAIRVLRILKLSSELKEVINCLINSVHKICHFLLLYLLINYVYAIIGVQLYKNVMGKCSTGNHQNKFDCEKSGNIWTPTGLSFDNAYQGVVALFVIGTTDDWFGFLQKILQNPGNSKFLGIIFIISFVMLMSFLLLQVLTGFVIVGYHKEREKDERFEVLDKTAQECIVAALNETPCRSINWTKRRFREKLWDIISSTPFQVFSLTFIVLNTIVLITQRYNQPDWLIQLQRYANLVLTIIFTVEIVVKMSAVPIRDFVRDAWLVFDALVILGGWIDIILYELNISSLNTSLFRLFRVARLMKFVGKGGNLRHLFLTFIKSMKSVPSIAILLALVIYLYAILGMELFGCIQLDLTPAINKLVNFQTFSSAVLLLVRVTTVDAWQDILLTCAHPNAHTCNLTTSSWQPYYSYLYFASFVLICSFWVTNLFLAVIMDNFVYLTHDISTLNLCHIQAFAGHWNRYDRHGVGYVSTDDLVNLLKRLDPPLGKGMFCPARLLYGKLTRLKIPVEAHKVVKFDEVLLLLVIDALNLQASNELIRHEIHLLVPKVSEDKLDRIIPTRDEPKVLNEIETLFYENCAAYVITGHFKIYTKILRQRRKSSVGGDYFYSSNSKPIVHQKTNIP